MPRSDSAPSKRRARTFRFAVASTALLGIAGYAVTQYATSSAGPPRCVVRASGEDAEDYEIEPHQAANAATISAVGSQRGLPERAVTIALATAMQESGLRNIEHGDRDSVGLFQQRPSQGWGTERQILDPVYSAGEFYDHLVEIPGYSRLPLTVAAQRVQRSGFPQAYAKHETNASALSAALTGRRGAAFSCTTGADGGAVKAGDPVEVRERLQREFGSDVLGDPAPDSAEATVSSSGSAGGGSGRKSKPTAELLVPAQPQQRGWELAHWAVAHSTDLGIERVSYGNRVWSAARSEEGWRAAPAAEGKGGAGREVRAVAIRLSAGRDA